MHFREDDPVPPSQACRLHPDIMLPTHRDDQYFGEPLPLHRPPLLGGWTLKLIGGSLQGPVNT